MLFRKICKLVTIFVYLDNKKAVFLGTTHKAQLNYSLKQIIV